MLGVKLVNASNKRKHKRQQLQALSKIVSRATKTVVKFNRGRFNLVSASTVKHQLQEVGLCGIIITTRAR